MATESGHQLHIFFFPFMAQGHMIPTVDMAKPFAVRGVKATVVTTPCNAPLVSKTVERTRTLGLNIDIQIVKFPTVEASLPEGCENVDSVSSPDMFPAFFIATKMLQEPLEKLLKDYQPSCLVADMFFPWATDVAAKFGIPRLVFHETCFFSLAANDAMRLYEPHKKVSSDSEAFVIPNFPGEIKLTRALLPDFTQQDVETDFTKLLKEAAESELRSYGVVVNSFYELEPVYADHYRKVLGRKAWHIGPMGEKASIDEHECLKWLGTKKPNSVVYICFGSIAKLSDSQLMEIAMCLEASGQQFIWVVRKGFEKRVEDKGLIIRGWAPQVLILDHEEVGGFVTYCGWNSTLEGVTTGLPMVTWPMAAEQFYNEKLATEVLKIGVGVGTHQWTKVMVDDIKMEAIEEAVRLSMAGDEAEEISRAKALGKMAKRVVEEGGSSYSDLNALIKELSSL
ncbi:hypothetical protein ACJW30_07G096800 [Castanea mollissima]